MKLHAAIITLFSFVLLVAGCSDAPETAPGGPAPQPSVPREAAPPSDTGAVKIETTASQPEPQSEPVTAEPDVSVPVSDDFARELERLENLAADAEFLEARNRARQVYPDFSGHPRRNELQAFQRRMRTALREVPEIRVAIRNLGAEEGGAQNVAAQMLMSADRAVAAALLRETVRDGEPALAAEAVGLLTEMRDERAAPVFFDRLEQAEDPPLRDALAEGVQVFVDHLPREDVRKAYERVKADAGFSAQPYAQILSAVWTTLCEGDKDELARLTGDPRAYAALREYVKRSMLSEDTKAREWARGQTRTFSLAVVPGDLVFWFSPAEGAVLDAGGHVEAWTDSMGSGLGVRQAQEGLRPEWVAARGGKPAALRFDGEGAYLHGEEAAGAVQGLEAYTLALWLKSNRTNSDRGVFYGHEPNEKDDCLLVRYDQEGWYSNQENLVRVGHRAGGDDRHYETSPGTQTTNWQFVAFTWESGGRITAYLDGEKDEPSHNAEAHTGGLQGIDDLQVGRSSKDKGRSWDGLIGDIWLYKRALTDEEIGQLFHLVHRR